MSEEYTPTERELQSDWVWAQTQFGPVGTSTYNEAFKRAIAKIKAEAWEECDDAWEHAYSLGNTDPWEHLPANPYK